MGLFDSYFDPSTYQGSGGLIDRLLAQLGTQAQPNPPMGPLPSDTAQYGASPIQAPAQIPPPVIQAGTLAPPIQQSPQSAQPSQLPQAPLLQPPPSSGGFGSAMRGAIANMQGGPLGMIGGALAGGFGMGQGTPLEQQQRVVLQNYQALIAAGVPEAKARLAAINPEAAKTIIGDAFGKDKYTVVKTGQNGLGIEQYEIFNPATGEHTPIRPTAADDSGGGLGNMNLSGKDYLASLPKAQANIVQGMVEGTIAPPSSFALAKPYWQNMISAAKNYDPSFDATNWGGRVAGTKDFSSGKSSEMVRSANQTIGHIGDLITKMDALKNGDYPIKNAAGNYINSQMGGAAVTGFQQTAHAVADELSKVFKGAGISDSEIRQWEQNLSPNMSPAQQREAVTTAMSLLQHSLSALEEKRLNSIGPVAAEKAGPLLKPDAQTAVQRIKEWAKGTGTNAPAATTRTGVNWSVE